jgi:hypothetical protein
MAIIIPFLFVLFSGCMYQQNMDIGESEAIQNTVTDQAVFSSSVYNSRNDWKRIKDTLILILIYRYSQAMCHTCIVEDLDELQKFQEQIGKGKILVIPAYAQDRSSEILLKNELSDFRYINIPVDSLVIPTSESGEYKRYFAFIGKNGDIEMVFFPKINYPQFTRSYFKEVKKRIKSQ